MNLLHTATRPTSPTPPPKYILQCLHLLWNQGVDPLQYSPNSPTTPPLSPSSPTLNEGLQVPLWEQPHLVHHVARLISPATMTSETVHLALLLVCRLRGMNRGEGVRVGAEPHLLSTALLIALKALDDWRIDSSAWVAYSKVSLETLNAMEREFLGKVGEEFRAFVCALEGMFLGRDCVGDGGVPGSVVRRQRSVGVCLGGMQQQQQQQQQYKKATGVYPQSCYAPPLPVAGGGGVQVLNHKGGLDASYHSSRTPTESTKKVRAVYSRYASNPQLPSSSTWRVVG
ncbi:hypothetical protein BCR33DRAFT_718685 [Rhizoclosmatium globosum]|uniref:Cyclin N-terminal domain-containing protein n=1 Tax=Rhizoclosmatium globosum TaxID=329046 RepID=A0A1Y2C3P7_9FUNG|nr:hypothetical protein BCR33DRAFT_718685 [Rhizoclosmatium globosum]|eukprot:ORY41517.1 hypothetical protein BCR33DRAFT_718685 [Rhizoclosmatium globosum]